jgi:hypothetical protein
MFMSSDRMRSPGDQHEPGSAGGMPVVIIHAAAPLLSGG